MLKANKLLMIFLFSMVTLYMGPSSIQILDVVDALGLVNTFMIVLITAVVGLYFMKSEEFKKDGKCCISHNIDRDRNLIQYMTL